MVENFAKKAKSEFKKGEKELETGIFKWKPDYNSAVSYFEESAKLYKSAKMWDDSIKSYEKCILCNEKLNDAWATARNLESIINILIE